MKSENNILTSYNFLLTQCKALTRGLVFAIYTKYNSGPITGITGKVCPYLPSLPPREKDGSATSRKQTEQINKESSCQCRLHISTAQKETLTFIIAAATGPYFPRCHGEKIPYFFLYRSSVAQKMPRKCLSL